MSYILVMFGDTRFQQPFDVGIIHLHARYALAGDPAWFTSVAGLQSQFHHNAEILPDALTVIFSFIGPLHT